MLLSCDPGSKRAGIALFDDSGSLIHSQAVRDCCMDNGGLGLSAVTTELSSLVFGGPYHIDTIVIEKLFIQNFGGRKVNTSLPMKCNFAAGVLTGAILGASNAMAKLSPMGVKIVQVMPRTWQSHVVGKMVDDNGKKRKCEKKDIREAAERLYGAKFQNDVADAVCIGHWYLTKGRLN